MDLRFTKAEEAFRDEVRDWLESRLAPGGAFHEIRGRGGPGDEESCFEPRLAWERALGEARWNCVAWPEAHGGRGASLTEQVIYHEEYARAHGPGRLGHIGETLIGPTLIALGTDAQRARFLPGIRFGEHLWCQGYSEPNAGSDLANVQTRAERDGDAWSVTGQKIWTSGAHWSHWCFVIARTNPDAPKHRGLSYLLVPMDQPGRIEVRPIIQITGDGEFNEVFFDGARTDLDNVVGEVDGGWRVAMATLGFERGASTLGQQLEFQNEMEVVLRAAQRTDALKDPSLRQRVADVLIRLELMRLNALRTLSTAKADGSLGREAMINKIYWATLHRDMGKLAMDILGPWAETLADEDDLAMRRLERLFLFSRSDTIYAGTNQIQRNIIGERALGLPKEPKPAPKG